MGDPRFGNPGGERDHRQRGAVDDGLSPTSGGDGPESPGGAGREVRRAPVPRGVKTQIHPEGCHDDSVPASDTARDNINRFTMPKDARDLMLATVMAISVLTSLWLWSKLHDA